MILICNEGTWWGAGAGAAAAGAAGASPLCKEAIGRAWKFCVSPLFPWASGDWELSVGGFVTCWPWLLVGCILGWTFCACCWCCWGRGGRAVEVAPNFVAPVGYHVPAPRPHALLALPAPAPPAADAAAADPWDPDGFTGLTIRRRAAGPPAQ